MKQHTRHPTRRSESETVSEGARRAEHENRQPGMNSKRGDAVQGMVQPVMTSPTSFKRSR